MKQMKFSVPLYEFDVTLIQIEDNKEDLSAVVRKMRGVKCTDAQIDEVLDEMKKDGQNGGSTYRNFDLKKFLVIFYVMGSVWNRENVYEHEKRHIEDRILEWASVDDKEAAAFLAGYLGEQFYKFRLLCQNNNTKNASGTSNVQ